MNGPGRTVSLSILRYDPAEPAVAPHFETFEIEEAPGMTLFIALTELRATRDPSLKFDFVCRAAICGSCAMVIDGRPGLACRTLVRDLPDHTTLAPLPGFELIGDLSVDTGNWLAATSARLETWVHTGDAVVDLDRIEAPMDPDLAQQLHELDRCIECGCCIAACGTHRMHPDFVGAVGLVRLARFALDPRDLRTDAAFYELIGSPDGVFGCMSLLACQDVCPKELPLATQLAFLRRRMLIAAVRA